MRRLVAIAALAAALAAVWLVSSASSDDDGGGKGHYWVELDNAFGLITGGDVKIAGVRAGKITDLKLDRRTLRARVGIRIDRAGFGSLRSDVHCESRPQSLIGEYFVDCDPGTARKELPRGATIPVSHTSSTIAPDLVNDILRRPQAERLSILLGELGAAVAGRGDDLNGAIRRAAPALRETDKVLAILARQNEVLRDLTANADKVIGDLAANKSEVGRFVTTARRTAVASAERQQAIAEGFRRLPGFLRQLQPTMKALGQTADAQTPALRNLRASAKDLVRFFNDLGPYADASKPAFEALGRAAKTGLPAVTQAVPVVDQLKAFSGGTPELANNLAIVLQHLDDPAHAVEDDPRAAKATGRAMPTGFSGLEALLTYVYTQTMSTNIYDQNEHILKIGLIPPSSPCADYADVARAKEVGEECAAALGPNQPGINFTDPSKPDTPAARAHRRGERKRIDGDRPAAGTPQEAPLAQEPAAPAPAPKPAPKPPVIDLSPIIPGLPPIKLPGGLGNVLDGGKDGGRAADGKDKQEGGAALLDYLLGR